MAVTAWNESVASRSLSIAVGEGFKYTRSFTVQVDDPATPLLDIVQAVPVPLWASHPENTFSKAQKFDIKPRGSSLLLYEVTVAYDRVALKDESRGEDKPGTVTPMQFPRPVWSGGTRVESEPFQVDVNLVPVSNSAGVPFPDAEREVYRQTLSATVPFPDLAAAVAAMRAVIGKVNGAAWAGERERTWLCTDARWSWKHEDQGGVQLRYVEASFEFAFNEKGWAMKLLDVGYQEKADQDGNPDAGGFFLAPIKGGDGKPVKEPVALENGLVMKPPPGPNKSPNVINDGDGVMPYEDGDFGGNVGEPQ